jgi:SapC
VQIVCGIKEMASFQIITNSSHRDLCCHAEYDSRYGHDVPTIMVLPLEIVEVQREYPILFRKQAETGLLFPNAMLGFKMNENVFLDGKGNWSASYIPLAAEKGPFIINFQPDANGENIPLVCADLEDIRFSKNSGNRLFNDDGTQTPYFERVSQVLARMHQGAPEISIMVQAFLDCDLLEPVSLDIEFKNGEKVKLTGAYTIPEEKLNELSSEKLYHLNRQGFLGLAHMISASLNNIGKLIEIKNR